MKTPRLASNGLNRLSLFCDVSGRLCEESRHNEFFTAGAMVIPTCDEPDMRGSISRDTPKWRDSDARSLSSIENVLQSHVDIFYMVITVHKTQPAWTRFWDDGECSYQTLSSMTKRASTYVKPLKPTPMKPANLLKGWALGKCLALGLGSYLHMRGKPRVLGPDGLSALYLRITCDSDIQGQQNQNAFQENGNCLCSRTKLRKLFGIRLYLDAIEFKTEQDESSLLVPDYLAGYVQYSSDKAGCIPLPAGLLRQDADHFGQILSTLAASGRFISVEHSFDEIYPNLGLP